MILIATTIGRVEFIVGLDGKGLKQEAKREAAKLSQMGEDAGEEYGVEFGKGAGEGIAKDKSLNKAMQRLQDELAKEGDLAGKTYSKHLTEEAIANFRKMEKESVKALSSKKGFENFAKNFPSIDAALEQLTVNVRRLAEQKVSFFGDELDDEGKPLKQYAKFFENFQAGPAMQQVDKWTNSIKASEAQAERTRKANEKLRRNFTRLKASLDKVSFDALAEREGSAGAAADVLRKKMKSLGKQGGATKTEMDRFNIVLEKLVENHTRAAEATEETRQKHHSLALQMNESRDRAAALDRAMAWLGERMGDALSFEMFSDANGGPVNAMNILRQSIEDVADEFQLSETKVDGLNRKLNNLTANLIDHNEAAEIAAGRQHAVAERINITMDRTRDLDLAMADLNSRMGDSKAFKRYAKQLGGSENATRDLHGRVAHLATAFKLPAATVEALTRKITNFGESLSEAASKAADSGGGGGWLMKFLGGKGGLSTGVIIAAVAGLVEPAMVGIQGLVAALSALIGVIGSGLAGAAAIGGAALAGLVWTFWKASEALGMMKDVFPKAQQGMDNLAAASKADSAEFARQWGPALADFTNKLAQLWRDDRMGEMAGKALGKVTEAFTAVISSPAYLAFQTAMETTIPNSIANIGTAAANLTGGLLNIFAAAGPSLEKVTGLFSTFTAEWAAGIQDDASSGKLQKSIEQMVDDFLLLLDTVKKVWDATTKFFEEGREAGRKLLTVIGDNFEKWEKWMGSVEGQKALDKFFQSGIDLSESLFDQLPKIQNAFDKIVTQDAVDRTTDLLDQLGDFVEGPGAELVQLFGELDIFGTIATVLNDILTPLKPLFDLLTPILGVVAGILEIFSRWAGVILTILAPAFIPLRFAFEILNTIIQEFLIWSEPLFSAFEDVGTAIAEAADAIWVALEPAIQDLYQAFLDLLPSPEELARIINENVIPAIETLRDWIINKFIPKLQELITWIEDTVEQYGGWETIMGDVEQAFKDLKTWIETDGIKILDVLLAVVEGLVTAWNGLQWAIGLVKGAIEGIKSTFTLFYTWFSGAPKWLTDTISAIGNFLGLMGQAQSAYNNSRLPSGSNSRVPEDAAGRIVSKAHLSWTGEAGPEAIVPLRRPLSQVDPSVRALSAFAQGRSAPGNNSGGGSRPTRMVNVAPGAIVIQGDRAPEATATNVVNRLAQRIAG